MVGVEVPSGRIIRCASPVDQPAGQSSPIQAPRAAGAPSSSAGAIVPSKRAVTVPSASVTNTQGSGGSSQAYGLDRDGVLEAPGVGVLVDLDVHEVHRGMILCHLFGRFEHRTAGGPVGTDQGGGGPHLGRSQEGPGFGVDQSDQYPLFADLEGVGVGGHDRQRLQRGAANSNATRSSHATRCGRRITSGVWTSLRR